MIFFVTTLTLHSTPPPLSIWVLVKLYNTRLYFWCIELYFTLCWDACYSTLGSEIVFLSNMFVFPLLFPPMKQQYISMFSASLLSSVPLSSWLHHTFPTMLSFVETPQNYLFCTEMRYLSSLNSCQEQKVNRYEFYLKGLWPQICWGWRESPRSYGAPSSLWVCISKPAKSRRDAEDIQGTRE